LNSDLNKINKCDLVKIIGKSITSFEDKPTLIVLEKIMHNNKHPEFKLYCSETGRIFYWPFSSGFYQLVLKLDDYVDNLERESS
tara:strand:+ start:11958 stop:12209 length:252 start_codon:yes stop_codon:yes gene_type:complete